jgi:hypothetical protein
MHAHEVYAHEAHTNEVHAHKIHAHETHAHEVHTHEVRSDFCGEIEESSLLVCHFYLPMERTDIYRHKILIGQASFSRRTQFCLRNATTLLPKSVRYTPMRYTPTRYIP